MIFFNIFDKSRQSIKPKLLLKIEKLSIIILNQFQYISFNKHSCSSKYQLNDTERYFFAQKKLQNFKSGFFNKNLHLNVTFFLYIVI